MSRPFLQLTRVVAALTAVAVVYVLYTGRGSSESSEEAPIDETGLVDNKPAAGADVIALLDGLKKGDKLETVTVLAIDEPSERLVMVHAGVDEVAFSIGIGRAGNAKGKPPPVTTEKYELGYGNVRGTGELPPGAMGNAAEALAQRIRRRENGVPTPTGM